MYILYNNAFEENAHLIQSIYSCIIYVYNIIMYLT